MRTICPTITEKVAVVTGGAKGIGARIARRFALNGYAVAISYRNSKNEADKLVAELSERGRAIAVCGDLSRFADAKRLRDEVFAAFGRCDVLVNNAGSSFYGLLADMREEDIKSVIGDGLLTSINATKAFYDDFAFGGRGCIVNVSSVWGIRGASCEAVYSAAKAGVIGFTRAMAKELAPSGVRVNAVAPGAIETDMIARFSSAEKEEIRREIPLGRIGDPNDVASAVLFLSSDAASYITGETLNVSGGYVI